MNDPKETLVRYLYAVTSVDLSDPRLDAHAVPCNVRPGNAPAVRCPARPSPSPFPASPLDVK